MSGICRCTKNCHFLHHASGFLFYPVIVQHGYMGFEIPRTQLFPAALFLHEYAPQGFRVVRLRFKAFKLPKLRVGVAVKILSGGYAALPMLINKRVIIGRDRLFYHAPEVLLIVKLIEVAFELPVLFPGQLHQIGKDGIAGLLPVKPPCVVLPCVL